jgi:minor extracellular protease Epr
LGFVVTIFHITGQSSVGSVLKDLRKLVPSVWADANRRYQLLGDDTKTYGAGLIGWKTDSKCGRNIRIGIIDTAIDINHPQLAGRHIFIHNVVTTGIHSAQANHGTEIASLLVGRDIGLMPAARLYAASVFRNQSDHVDTTAEWIVRGLDWLAINKTSVINLSLGGSRNLIIELALQRLLDRGVTIVAAAGNSGPNAPPVYPAAQPGVIAVTAIDRNLKPYQLANRGDYIAFAAPGVDVWAATPGKLGQFVSGTSYAAPFVTAAIAAYNGWPRATLLKHLQATARDLGKKGKDPVFGWGLLQQTGCESNHRHAAN